MLVVVAQSHDVVTVGPFQRPDLGVDDKEFIFEVGMKADVVGDGLAQPL
uniref:Uncharacterized protein n=1 Tax=Thermogemmatispora argillosa TaxID=2045280 RepID=A0A455T9H2_9CHLR|nr:hypothetical protein KTA_42850 [Thermogemmatispora argillosa]